MALSDCDDVATGLHDWLAVLTLLSIALTELLIVFVAEAPPMLSIIYNYFGILSIIKPRHQI